MPCTCPSIKPSRKNSTQVSFTATLSLAKTSLTTSTDLPFDSDVSNIGNAYNATLSQFTAPVSGLYGFSLTVFMNPGSWVGMHLVKNGHSVLKVRTGHYLYRSTNRSVENFLCSFISYIPVCASVCLLVCHSMNIYYKVFYRNYNSLNAYNHRVKECPHHSVSLAFTRVVYACMTCKT